MNYQRIYDELIFFRKSNEPKGYVEKHHIQIRSLGGSDDETNLVKLTGREHYVAHLLLHKILKCSESAYALWMMQCRSENDKNPSIRSSRMYEWARKEFAKYISRNNRITSKGERNSQYRTRWICSIALEKNKKISIDEPLQDGWILGRNKWKARQHRGKSYSEIRIETLAKLYADYVNEKNMSVRDFAKNNGISHATLYTGWAKMFPGWNKAT